MTMLRVVARRAFHGATTLRRFPQPLQWHATRALSSAGRILCVDVPTPFADETCVQELVQRGHTVELASSENGKQLQQQIASGFDALLVSPETKISREMLRVGSTNQLQFIAVPSDAIDSARIDLMEATSQGIMLLQLEKKQVSDKFSVEAEIALSLMIQLARHLPASLAATKTGPVTEREQFTGVELYEKKLGIVGLGQAGKCVAEMARAMGLQVFGYDPNLTQGAAEAIGVKSLSLDELYARCDFLSFHAPLTGRTRRMFDDAALAKCKRGVHIISVAEYRGRNGVLNEATLLDGLASGHIAGLGLDLLREDGEQSSDQHAQQWEALMSHERVLTNCHEDTRLRGDVGAARKYRTIAENLSDALARRYYRGVANGVFMGETLLPEMQPFLRLGEGIGRLLHQLSTHPEAKSHGIARVSIATSGGIQVDITTPKAKSAIQGAVMKGMVQAMEAGEKKASLLNSSLQAMSMGIDVRQGELTGLDAQHLNNSIAVELETKSKEKWLVMGSVFGEDPRIVRLNEYTDFPAFRPEGNLLLFKNEDKPGAIAGILKQLADARINIANFGLSRQPNAGLAMGILALDCALPADTLAALQKVPSVQSIRFARI